MVGAYYPWLDHKWGGFVTSVPIKNPLISDVFSQFYLWKQIIINSIKNLSFPFWNIYSYSGYPLYANFHSGSLNPFNLLLLVFGNQTGWSFFVISQFFFSSITFYLFLKQLYPKKKLPCLAGSIVYSYSGFMVTWSQFVTAGFAMVWLPLVFLNIEKFFETKRYKYLIYIPILYFLIMTSGHLQALAYSYIISGLYFVYKLLQNKKIDKKKIIN
ncbi:MAG TPA: YfhO family protein, partial [Exilispira sp.]|nr:YfhO family protein [Exilispira sp.]